MARVTGQFGVPLVELMVDAGRCRNGLPLIVADTIDCIEKRGQSVALHLLHLC